MKKVNKSYKKTPAPAWFLASSGVIVSALIIFVAPNFHLPFSAQNLLVWKADSALHAHDVILYSSVFVLSFALSLAYLSHRHFALRRKLLDDKRQISDLQSMSWQDFELLVGACYRRQGYSVTENGLGGADGGIDLILTRRSEKVIVQCKKWNTSSVGAPVVREMYGLMLHHKVDRVKIVCAGKFTSEAVSFATDKPIELISGEDLLLIINGK